MPLSGLRLDSVRLGVVEGYVLEGGWASLQDWDQASGLEPDRGKRLDSRPAEPMAQFDPSSQIVRVQHAGPVDVVVQADLVLDSVARKDVLRDKCQVPYAQLVAELLSKLAGQRRGAWLAEAHSLRQRPNAPLRLSICFSSVVVMGRLLLEFCLD
jgi:hypothetical protein